MVVKNVNFKSFLFASLVAGYMMYFADHWLKGFLGLFGMLPGTTSTWWFITHHAEAIIFALPFVWPAIYSRLPGGAWLKGLIYGFLFWLLVTIISLISGALGAVIFKQMGMSGAGIITRILLHLVYGFFLGVLYNPPAES